MATPDTIHLDQVESTQDEARVRFEARPVLVTATSQTGGRGRNRASWLDADRSLAASLALRPDWPQADWPRLALVAGLAVLDILPSHVGLKWPNDVIIGSEKVGGLLAEVSDGVVVIGFGLNIYWDDPPEGMAGVHDSDPGPRHGQTIAARWADAVLGRIESGPDSWGREEYAERCVTIGHEVSWQPNGAGVAVGVAESGALLVVVDGRIVELSSGSVNSVRLR